MIFLGLDLNCVETICDPASNLLVGGTHEFGQVGVCANHAAFAIDHVSPLCGALWRRAQGQEFFLPGSLSLHGFCSTDLSRKFARHRSVPACASGQAVPHGHQEPGVAQYSGRCQREPRLAHLRRLCPVAHRHCPSSLCRRIVWRRSQRHGLRSGCQHHRPVSVGLSLGSVSLDQGGYQVAHALGPAWQHPFVHPAMANCTTSTFWTCCCPSRVLSTSWTEATSTSSGFINCTRRKASLSPAPNRTSKPNVAIRTRSIEARG